MLVGIKMPAPQHQSANRTNDPCRHNGMDGTRGPAESEHEDATFGVWFRQKSSFTPSGAVRKTTFAKNGGAFAIEDSMSASVIGPSVRSLSLAYVLAFHSTSFLHCAYAQTLNTLIEHGNQNKLDDAPRTVVVAQHSA